MQKYSEDISEAFASAASAAHNMMHPNSILNRGVHRRVSPTLSDGDAKTDLISDSNESSVNQGK